MVNLVAVGVTDSILTTECQKILSHLLDGASRSCVNNTT